MVPERYEGESRSAYHKRLIYGKCEDGSLADTDFSELAVYLYGKPYSSDTARRMIKGSYLSIKALDEDSLDGLPKDADALAVIKAERRELQKERQRFYDQRREYNKTVVADARFERLQERLMEAASDLVDERPLATDIVHIGERGTEAVLVFCDWHFGMTTDNIWNSYNTDICRQRVAHVLSETIDRIKLHKPSVLHVLLLGDLCHGAIHTSARVASEELVCDQIMKASEMVAEAISILSKYVNKVVVYSTYGNHMRTVQNKKDSVHSDNMERLIPWWLTYRLQENENVEIRTDTEHEFILLDVCGKKIVATHGDLDSITVSPRLLGQLFSKKLDISIDCVILGDKHHLAEAGELGVDAILCRALCGSDDYANEKRLYDDPGQTLIIFKEGVGRDATYSIKA